MAFKMIPKKLAPQMNRQQRRHPERLASTLGMGGSAASSNYLLAGLLLRGGSQVSNVEGAQV